MFDTSNQRQFFPKPAFPNPMKISAFILLLLLLLSGMTGLSAAPQQEGPAAQEEPPAQKTITVTDMRGRSVTIPSTVNSVIALEAGSLRLVSYLDAADKIIAVEDAGHGREKSPYGFFSLATYRTAFPGWRFSAR